MGAILSLCFPSSCDCMETSRTLVAEDAIFSLWLHFAAVVQITVNYSTLGKNVGVDDRFLGKQDSGSVWV